MEETIFTKDSLVQDIKLNYSGKSISLNAGFTEGNGQINPSNEVIFNYTDTHFVVHHYT